MCERLKQAVLKTAVPQTVPGVRIPLPPPATPSISRRKCEVLMSVKNREKPQTVAATSAVVPELRNFVDGEFATGDRFFDDLNPADGTVIARVSEAGPAIVDGAVSAARRALHGEWGKAGVRQRAALLYKIAD